VIEAGTECIDPFPEIHVYVSIDVLVYFVDMIVYGSIDSDVYEVIYIQGRWQLTSKHEPGPQGHGSKDTGKRPKNQSPRVNLALGTIPKADRTSGDNELHL
jgi:hypothetical protein